MPSFTKLLILSAMVAVGSALAVRDAESHLCDGATLISSVTIHAGDHDLVKTTHSCSSASVERRQTAPEVINICGANCTTSCNNVTGILPPISQDCQTIENSIVILAPTMAPDFLVLPSHVQTLTFGTCSYFLENVGSTEIQACWADLSSAGHAAGAACFPPNQPFSPEGLCTASDGTWAFGATHS